VRQALVTTKLRAPRTRPNLVERPRLREALVRNEGRRLTLVSAPAGFGKTTLLSEWLEVRSGDGGSIAWLSLEEADNDPARFLTYLVRALQPVEEGIGEGILASLRSPDPPPVEVVVGALINELTRVEQNITFAFDDYHLITSKPVHEAVYFLMEHMPENVHLVISGRTDPPLSLAKLRARDQMAEIRAADLRFTSEEATAFLGDVMGLTLSAGDVAALEEVTEGWVAALQLAALSMRDCADVSGFVEAFSGSNRHVLDFLTEEVLERQPEGVRNFLLKTSVLGRMSAPLCHTLTGRNDGQEMLEMLERENQRTAPPGGGLVPAKRLDLRSGRARTGGARSPSSCLLRRACSRRDVEPRRGYDALELAGGVARGSDAPSTSAVDAVRRGVALGGAVGRRRTPRAGDRARRRRQRGPAAERG
jgi:LuxR family transcriptional regulator, maltose regulon positive regulatory protein